MNYINIKLVTSRYLNGKIFFPNKLKILNGALYGLGLLMWDQIFVYTFLDYAF